MVRSLAEQIPDFRPQLRHALEQAPVHTYTKSGSNSDQQMDNGSSCRYLSDTAVIRLGSGAAIPAHTVATKKAAHYPALLEQAAEIGTSQTEISDDARQYLDRAARHELQHAQKAREVSPLVIIKYAASFVLRRRGADLSVRLAPQVLLFGNLRKIDYARVLAAPDELSPSDIAAFKNLGYASPEDIESRLKILESGYDQTSGSDTAYFSPTPSSLYDHIEY